jgi:hypothetical protein
MILPQLQHKVKMVDLLQEIKMVQVVVVAEHYKQVLVDKEIQLLRLWEMVEMVHQL